MSPNPLSIDALLRHASGLRALAHGLLADEHAAEDVVQETWVAALESPPRNATAPGGWLRQVARRLALKKRRGEGRRTAREELVSRDEALASVDEVAENREVLRHVVNAVLDLEEPYQSVVVMRYYQDLPPREIARQLGISVGTVKSQLHRAQQQLRGRLDADVGGSRGQWAFALASVTNWSPPLPPVPLEPTGAGGGSSLIKGVAMEWKLALGLASLATLAVSVRGVLPDPATSQAGGDEVVLQESTASINRLEKVPAGEAGAPALVQKGNEIGKRVALGADPVSALASAKVISGMALGPYEYTVAGIVVDEDDRPVAGAEVHLAPRFAPLNHWGRTDGEGRFVATWRGHDATMELLLGIRGSSRGLAMQTLELEAGEPTNLRLAMRNERTFTVRLDGAEDGLHEVRATVAHGRLRDANRFVEREIVEQGNVSFGVRTEPQLHLSDAGDIFRWPIGAEHVIEVANVARLQLVEERIAFGEVHLRGFEFSTEVHVGTEIEIVEGPADSNTVLVTGTIRDASGAPVDLPVVIRRHDGDWGLAQEMLVGTETEAGEGDFRVVLPRERVELLVGGGDRGQASLTLDLTTEDAPSEVRWNPVLDRGEEIRGRLLNAEGEPLAGWIVEFLIRDGDQPWHDTTLTRDDGTFAMPNVPSNAGELVVRRLGTDFPVHLRNGVWPGPGEHEIQLAADELRYGGLTVDVTSATGEAMDDAEVRVFHPESGRGLRMGTDDGSYSLDRLPVGRYQVVAGTPETGFVDLGGFQVLGGETTDLGAVALLEPGQLHWGAIDTPGETGWTLMRRAAGVDMLVTEGGDGQPFDRMVAPGDYALVFQSNDFSAPMIALTVLPGGSTTTAPSFDGLKPFSFRFEEAPADNIEFAVFDANEAQRYQGTFAVDELGRLFLEPGTYALRASSDDTQANVTFEVPGDGSVLTVTFPNEG